FFFKFTVLITKLQPQTFSLQSYVANILIAVNPYKEIQALYSPETIQSYRGKSLGGEASSRLCHRRQGLPRHASAETVPVHYSQRGIWSSYLKVALTGKTESTKHLLKFLCDSWGAEAGPIQQKILDANPVLEAFGNAKTTRNNNSSRFGKFIEVHFDKNFKVAGGHISHYLLEKSRICSPQGDERSYHIFYMLMAGAPDGLRQKLGLTKPDDFNYLKSGCTRYFTNPTSEKKLVATQKSSEHTSKGPLKDILLDDVTDFVELDQALSRLGLSDGERLQIYTTVAAVHHLGNIEFEDNPEDTRGGCRVASSKERALVMASKLLEIDAGELRQALVARVMQSSRGGLKGTVIMVPLKIYEANNARDALAKAIYSNLFDYIVNRINQSIPFQASSYYIGVLDIAGFEFFTVNSFEQFCINYCNEKLQQFFNERILKYEQELYKREGLSVPEITFVDNQDCIDVIEAKNKGILTLLDEESKLPKPSYTHFTEEVHKAWPKEYRLGLPRSSKLKAHRSLRDDEGFLVRHFAGAVCYQTKQFIDKNNDALHASLEGIIQDSKNKLIQLLFATSMAQKGKLTFISVGNKFKTQLGELMEKLKNNGTNFIRCVKPNSKMIDNQFDGSLSLMQLKCSGMTSVLELMEHGYPSRTPFADLHGMYKDYLPNELKVLSPKTFCEAMFHSLKLQDRDFKFGVTRVFFRPGKFAEFDKIMRSDPENLKSIVANVKKWLVKSRWIKAQFCALTVIKMKNKIAYRKKALLIVQKSIRGYLVKKRHAPRIKAFKNIRALEGNLKKKKLQEQKNAEEQERLRKIQEELERQKRLKEEEERKQREEEEMRKKKAEIEARRKIEEEERKRQEEADRKMAMELQAQQEKLAQEERRYQEQLEQERQDRELALRLAQESNGQLEETPPMIRKSEAVKNQQANLAKSKYDLSKWKYSELRDTINTSCDIELLEACRHEFHRRLKVYHAWKAKNRKRTTMEENERAPRSVMESATRTPRLPQKAVLDNNSQRFFRIPFQRPGGDQSKRGWWYAHFDGQYVARQMELHPDKTPILLVAGKDDMQMCELSLEETGLTRKRGAEILESEFNKDWERNADSHTFGRPIENK
ncbi:hypothetical protein NQ318_011800, partial [Aromia moschata]